MKTSNKKKRPTEDEKKKIKSAIEELINVTKKLVEVKVPIDMAIHIMKRVYTMQNILVILDKIRNEIERK